MLEKKICKCNEKELGVLLLEIIGDSRLRGNFNEKSDCNKYAIYLPDIHFYLSNEENYMNKFDEKTKTTFIPINSFFDMLISGDYLIYEIISAQEDNQFTVYKNKLFKDMLNDLFDSAVLFSKETLKNLLNTFEDKYKHLDMKADRDSYLKDFSNAYALMFEILELTKTGMIEFPLKKKDMLCDIRYNKDFFDLNKDKLLSNMENFDAIMKKAIDKNDESIKVIPDKLDEDKLKEIFNKELYKLVKEYYF